MINEAKKHTIKRELKVFLQLLLGKINNYYGYCVKGFISKWQIRYQ
jgi:hypothetical protein